MRAASPQHKFLQALVRTGRVPLTLPRADARGPLPLPMGEGLVTDHAIDDHLRITHRIPAPGDVLVGADEAEVASVEVARFGAGHVEHGHWYVASLRG